MAIKKIRIKQHEEKKQLTEKLGKDLHQGLELETSKAKEEIRMKE